MYSDACSREKGFVRSGSFQFQSNHYGFISPEGYSGKAWRPPVP